MILDDDNPLHALEAAIAAAANLPAADPYIPAERPLERLAAHVRGDDLASRPANSDVRPLDTSTVEARIGREVMAIVGSGSLSPAARLEAVRRLVVALDAPTPDNIRSALAVLITGRQDA